MLTIPEMQLIMLALKVAHDTLDAKFGKMLEETRPMKEAPASGENTEMETEK